MSTIGDKAKKNMELLEDAENLLAVSAEDTDKIKKIEAIAEATRIAQAIGSPLLIFHVPNLHQMLLSGMKRASEEDEPS